MEDVMSRPAPEVQGSEAETFTFVIEELEDRVAPLQNHSSCDE